MKLFELFIKCKDTKYASYKEIRSCEALPFPLNSWSSLYVFTEFPWNLFTIQLLFLVFIDINCSLSFKTAMRNLFVKLEEGFEHMSSVHFHPRYSLKVLRSLSNFCFDLDSSTCSFSACLIQINEVKLRSWRCMYSCQQPPADWERILHPCHCHVGCYLCLWKGLFGQKQTLIGEIQTWNSKKIQH